MENITVGRESGAAALRHFEITGGLRERYGLVANEHTLENVIALHHTWQQHTNTVLGCLIQPVRISYGVPVRGSVHDYPAGVVEPGFLLSGMLHVIYQRHVTDVEAVSLLNSLAEMLAAGLRQERLFLVYQQRAWIMDYTLPAKTKREAP